MLPLADLYSQWLPLYDGSCGFLWLLNRKLSSCLHWKSHVFPAFFIWTGLIRVGKQARLKSWTHPILNKNAYMHTHNKLTHRPRPTHQKHTMEGKAEGPWHELTVMVPLTASFERPTQARFTVVKDEVDSVPGRNSLCPFPSLDCM